MQICLVDNLATPGGGKTQFPWPAGDLLRKFCKILKGMVLCVLSEFCAFSKHMVLSLFLLFLRNLVARGGLTFAARYGLMLGMKVEIRSPISPAKGTRRRSPRKTLCGWREAERYFKQYRDPQAKPTLPKLTCLDEASPMTREMWKIVWPRHE